ncbi:MAG: four helix bundle protein [Bacteroidales bacterium]
MRIERFEDLSVWKESRELVKTIYEIVNSNENLKKDFKLVSQITSASLSIISNIAEGFFRKSNKEFIQFLYISKGSISEVQSILYIISDLKYINLDKFSLVYNKLDKIAKMCSNLIKYLSETQKR